MGRNAPGIVVLCLVEAVLLTIPVSLILIWWYRRALGRLMTVAGDGDFPAIVTSDPRTGVPPCSDGLLRWRVATVYSLAAACAGVYWAVLLFQSGGAEFAPLRGFGVAYAYCWPIVPTLATLLALDRRWTLATLLGYMLLGMAVTAGWREAELIALDAAPSGLVLLIVANRRIRGVSPLVLAALLVFTFSSVIFNEFLIRLADRSGTRNALLIFGAGGWNLWFLLATVPVGYLGWRLLIVLNGRFQRRAFSDAQLLVDSFWLIVAFVISANLAISLGWRGLWGLGGFAVYRVVVTVGLAVWPAPKEPGVRLLVLRVFGFQKRSEKLFDSVILRWRFSGPVRMIAGTDLAARTIDPGDSLAFASGGLRSRFVSNAEDLRERLQQMDEGRDPDGHFRVTEFFCQANTWMPTLETLLGCSDVTLMDLRGFDKTRSGCLFELEQLKRYGRLGQTVFVVDPGTDLELFRTVTGEVQGMHLAGREQVWGMLQAVVQPRLSPRVP